MLPQKKKILPWLIFSHSNSSYRCQNLACINLSLTAEAPAGPCEVNLLLTVPLGRGSKTDSFGSLSWEGVKNRYQRALRLHKNNESGFTYSFEVSEAHMIGLGSSRHQSALGSLCVSVSLSAQPTARREFLGHSAVK